MKTVNSIFTTLRDPPPLHISEIVYLLVSRFYQMLEIFCMWLAAHFSQSQVKVTPISLKICVVRRTYSKSCDVTLSLLLSLLDDCPIIFSPPRLLTHFKRDACVRFSRKICFQRASTSTIIMTCACNRGKLKEAMGTKRSWENASRATHNPITDILAWRLF
jgi:hypothetical protein